MDEREIADLVTVSEGLFHTGIITEKKGHRLVLLFSLYMVTVAMLQAYPWKIPRGGAIF